MTIGGPVPSCTEILRYVNAILTLCNLPKKSSPLVTNKEIYESMSLLIERTEEVRGCKSVFQSNCRIQRKMVLRQKIMLAKSEIMPKISFSIILKKHHVLLKLMYTWCQSMRKEKFSQMKTKKDACPIFFFILFS